MGCVRYRLMGLRLTNLRLAPGTSGEVGPLQAFFRPAEAAAAATATATADEAEPAAETTPKRQRTQQLECELAVNTQQLEKPEAYVEDAEGEVYRYVGHHARAEAYGDAEGEAYVDTGVDAYDDTGVDAYVDTGVDAYDGQAAAAEEPLTLSQEMTMLERAMALSRQEAEAAAEVRDALQALQARDAAEVRDALQAREALQARDAAEVRDALQAREAREAREAKEALQARETRGAREVLTPSARLIPVAPMQSRAIKAPASVEWACACCTLINAASIMRCAMCDAMRGSLLPAATTLAAQGWAPSKVRGGGGTCAARRRGGRGAGSKASASARKPSAGGAGSLAEWVHHRDGRGHGTCLASGLEFSGIKQ